MIDTDAPYPELKKTHTAAKTGTPWTDRKPPPAAPVWSVIQGFASYWVLVAAVELGVFDALAGRGPSTADELAGELGTSGPHLAALLDAVVALGLLDQVRDRFKVNDTTLRYLTTDGPASMAALVAVANGPHENWPSLAETVRQGRPATPIEQDPAAFYRPLVEATFTTQWRAATRLDLKIGYSRSGVRRILDLGAGGAPWAIALLSGCPDATAVVNDLPGVIEVAGRKLAEHGVATRAELRPGDYHRIAIEPAAYDLVVLGHVCRAEGALGAGARGAGARGGAPALIARAYEALRPGGRLLLADYFEDNTRKYNPHAVLMGATMMASTEHGFTFTTETFCTWLRDAGFANLRLVEPIGFQQVYVATKPRR